jgi:hypothetical protein
MLLYQNKNYLVETNEDGVGYTIKNIVTGMIERKEGLLPVAYDMADELDKALEEFAQRKSREESLIQKQADGILLPPMH